MTQSDTYEHQSTLTIGKSAYCLMWRLILRFNRSMVLLIRIPAQYCVLFSILYDIKTPIFPSN